MGLGPESNTYSASGQDRQVVVFHLVWLPTATSWQPQETQNNSYGRDQQTMLRPAFEWADLDVLLEVWRNPQLG